MKLHHRTTMQPRREVYRIIMLQSAILILIAAICGFYHGFWARDILLGGIAAIVPNVFFAYRLFAKLYWKKGAALVKGFYWAVLQKMMLSIALLLLMLTLKTVNDFIVLCGFLSVHWGLWLTPMLYLMRKN